MISGFKRLFTRKPKSSKKSVAWGSAMPRERSAVTRANKAARRYSKLYDLQNPRKGRTFRKRISNFLKRGYYGIKGLFNRKRLSARVRSAQRHRDSAVGRLQSVKRKDNQLKRDASLQRRLRQVMATPQRTPLVLPRNFQEVSLSRSGSSRKRRAPRQSQRGRLFVAPGGVAIT
jgi:hypothetical protein